MGRRGGFERDWRGGKAVQEAVDGGVGSDEEVVGGVGRFGEEDDEREEEIVMEVMGGVRDGEVDGGEREWR